MTDNQENIVSQEEGKSASFQATYDQYYPALLFFAKSLVQDDLAAEDIVVDVFVKLWEREADFSRHKNIKAALYIAVKNTCRNYIRQRENRLSILRDLPISSTVTTDETILNTITKAEILQAVYTELQKLPPKRRSVMELFYVEGWDKNKIASHLNISSHTVRKHKLNGIHTLRRRFGVSPILGFLIYAGISYLFSSSFIISSTI